MAHNNISHSWKNRTCILATMHQKEQIIAPLVEKSLGIKITVPTDFNTDQFGTFTMDIKRTGNQREAARAKAMTALKMNGADLAIASEGSFGIHPSIPFLQNNLELISLVDTRYNLEIAGHYHSSSVIRKSHTVTTPDEVITIAKAWNFPDQGVILRDSATRTKPIYKDIETFDELYTISKMMLQRWFKRSLVMETDMRAHRCPARAVLIREATMDLIQNCRSMCPQCETPGFTITVVHRGLPCEHCHRPTDEVNEVVKECRKCTFKNTYPTTNRRYADPGNCQTCNP
jgi:hypothetical protein